MTADLGEPLFTVAVISDSHVNEAEDRSASPFASNRAANARFRHVVRTLEALAPDLVIHLGDMGNPVPHLATYGAAATAFHEIAGGLSRPLYLVPGNHCVGDKRVGWVPVPRVAQASLELYERHYGPHFRSFDHGPCHFVTLDSLLVNSGLELEGRQRRWLESDLEEASSAGRRIWVMMHYPAYVASPDEPAGYDNLDEPGRSWLLDLLARHRVEVACSGHAHNFFYNRHLGTDLYTVPATSFVRQDYSDLFSLAPADAEGGRDDGAKLGFSLFRVHERGHLHRLVRTHGREAAPDEAPPRDEGRPWAVAAVPLGVEVRENWLARVTLRANNSVSPFVRRWARNDWPLPVLEEVGIVRLRLPLQELAAAEVVERLAVLGERGYRFVVYSYGIPTEHEYRLVRERRALLAGWELVLALDQIDAVARGIARLATGELGGEALPCYLSEVREIARRAAEDANVKHEANYGFQLEEKRRLAELLAAGPLVETFSGLVFRLRRRGEGAWSPWRAIREAARLGHVANMRHQLHVLFSGSLTAERLLDEASAANRVVEAALAAWATPQVDVWLDTFEDVDRGYFVRCGLVDRRYNPRPAARALARLRRVLAGLDAVAAAQGSTTEMPEGRVWSAVLGGRSRWLLLPQRGARFEALPGGHGGGEVTLRVLDLAEGGETAVAATQDDGTLEPAQPLGGAGPLWVEAG